MAKHNIKTIEQTMLILDNNAYVKFCLDSFKDRLLNDFIGKDFSFDGSPVSVLSLHSNGMPNKMVCRTDTDYPVSVHCDMPMYLFNAGYRPSQFGNLFLTVNNLEFSVGSAHFYEFKRMIGGVIVKHMRHTGFEEHDIDKAVIVILGRFLKPEAEPTKKDC